MTEENKIIESGSIAYCNGDCYKLYSDENGNHIKTLDKDGKEVSEIPAPPKRKKQVEEGIIDGY